MSDATELNVATILRLHDAMESGDREALDRLLDEVTHPECEWTPLVAEVEGGYRGRERTREFFNDFLDTFVVRYEDRVVEPIGETGVLLRCNMVLEAKGSGVGLEQEMAVVYELEDGLFRRGRAYSSHVEAEDSATELRGASRA